MNEKQSTSVSLPQLQQALYTLLQEFDRVCRALDIPYILFSGTMLGAVRHEDFIPWDDDLDVAMLRSDYERFLRQADSVLDQEKFYLQKEFSQHWPMFFSKLRLNGTTCLEKYHPKDKLAHQGVYMDIFPCDDAACGKLGRKLQFYASKVVIAKALYKRGYDTDSTAKKAFMALCRVLPGKLFWKLTTGGSEKSGLVHVFLGASSDYAKSVFPRAALCRRQEAAFRDGKYPISEDYDTVLRTLYGQYMVLPPEEERTIKQHAILVDLERSYEHYADYRDGMHFCVLSRSIR